MLVPYCGFDSQVCRASGHVREHLKTDTSKMKGGRHKNRTEHWSGLQFKWNLCGTGIRCESEIMYPILFFGSNT